MSSKESTDTSFIPNLPSNPGPLADYRSLAKFDWKLLRIYFEGEDSLKAKYMIWNRLEKDPLFQKPAVTPSADDQKKLAAIRVKRIMEMKLLPNEIKNACYQKRVSWNFNDDYLSWQNLKLEDSKIHI